MENEDEIILDRYAIREWLNAVNEQLRKVGRVRMTETQIRDFALMLEELKYTLGQAKVAEKFFIWGKRTDYRTKEVQANFFFPTQDEMQQFNMLFVTIDTCNARLNEQKRILTLEMSDLNEQIRQSRIREEAKDKRIAFLENHPKLKEPNILPDHVREMTDTFQKVLDTKPKTFKREYENLKVEKKAVDRELTGLKQVVSGKDMEIQCLKAEKIDLKLKLMAFDSSITLEIDEVQFLKQQNPSKNEVKKVDVKVLGGEPKEMSGFSQIFEQKQLKNGEIQIKCTL